MLSPENRCFPVHPYSSSHAKRRCAITIISFSRSICRGGLAALKGVTGKPYPAVFHAIVTLSAPAGNAIKLSGILVSQPSPLGKGDRVSGGWGTLVNGLLETLSPTLFHTARTLSGSLRSPPSPRGEGFVRRYSFSTYACICSDNARIPSSKKKGGEAATSTLNLEP